MPILSIPPVALFLPLHRHFLTVHACFIHASLSLIDNDSNPLSNIVALDIDSLSMLLSSFAGKMRFSYLAAATALATLTFAAPLPTSAGPSDETAARAASANEPVYPLDPWERTSHEEFAGDLAQSPHGLDKEIAERRQLQEYRQSALDDLPKTWSSGSAQDQAKLRNAQQKIAQAKADADGAMTKYAATPGDSDKRRKRKSHLVEKERRFGRIYDTLSRFYPPGEIKSQEEYDRWLKESQREIRYHNEVLKIYTDAQARARSRRSLEAEERTRATSQGDGPPSRSLATSSQQVSQPNMDPAGTDQAGDRHHRGPETGEQARAATEGQAQSLPELTAEEWANRELILEAREKARAALPPATDAGIKESQLANLKADRDASLKEWEDAEMQVKDAQNSFPSSDSDYQELNRLRDVENLKYMVYEAYMESLRTLHDPNVKADAPHPDPETGELSWTKSGYRRVLKDLDMSIDRERERLGIPTRQPGRLNPDVGDETSEAEGKAAEAAAEGRAGPSGAHAEPADPHVFGEAQSPVDPNLAAGPDAQATMDFAAAAPEAAPALAPVAVPAGEPAVPLRSLSVDSQASSADSQRVMEGEGARKHGGASPLHDFHPLGGR